MLEEDQSTAIARTGGLGIVPSMTIWVAGGGGGGPDPRSKES